MASGEARINPEFAEWLRRARRAFEASHGDITQAELGALVATRLGRKRPFAVAVVSYWFQGREPRLIIGLAIADVLEADPFALIQGKAPGRPVVVAPRDSPRSDRVHPAHSPEERADLGKRRDRKRRHG